MSRACDVRDDVCLTFKPTQPTRFHFNLGGTLSLSTTRVVPRGRHPPLLGAAVEMRSANGLTVDAGREMYEG